MDKRFTKSKIQSKIPATPEFTSILEHLSRCWNSSLREFFQPMIDWIVESAEV
jgi:hypothetical protein